MRSGARIAAAIAIGFGVEATASPEREILALWKSYLTEPSDSLRATLWSTGERSSGPQFDLVRPYVYQGFSHFTVVHLGPAVAHNARAWAPWLHSGMSWRRAIRRSR